MNFKELHQQKSPLLLCNVWDVPSARIAAKLDFQAIGTSSSAIANMLGYNDGEEMSFTELLYIVRRISQNVKLPLSVDLEAGYSREPERVANHIEQLANSGVVGINLEDSIPSGGRILSKSNDFVSFLSAIRSSMKKRKIDLFINVRTDCFLMGVENALEESLRRIEKYTKAGADGIFVPFLKKEEDIKAIVGASSVPVNVLAIPDLPSVEALKDLGIKRISMGGFAQKKIYADLTKHIENAKTNDEITSIF